MSAIFIRTPRRLMGYGDCTTNPCGEGVPSDADPSTWPTANTCGPRTIPYQIDGKVVCLPEDAVSGYPRLPYADLNGWRMAQVNGQPVMGPDSYFCGPGCGQVTLGPNVACTPGGAALAMTGDGRVVLVAGQSPGMVYPTTSIMEPSGQTMDPSMSTGTPILMDAKVPMANPTPGQTPGIFVHPISVDVTDIAKIAAEGGTDVAQQVVDQITEMANSPEAAAVVASVQNQVQGNPIPFIASIVGGWYKGFWGAMIAGAAAYYLTKPKVQIAIANGAASLVVDGETALQASNIAANSGQSVNIAGYYSGR